MKAMILAAGRGERMRPLTDTKPKPLLEVGGKPLIVWHIQRLVSAGITRIVINHAWLGHKIEQLLGSGAQFGASLSYSPEEKALETAGGIANALMFFNQEPFLVINGDIWCDWNPAHTAKYIEKLNGHHALAWLLMVKNPQHNPLGDFLFPQLAKHALTFSGIGIYNPKLFRSIKPGTALPLAPLLREAICKKQVIASIHNGEWTDVGTPERLQELDQKLKQTHNSML